MNLKRFFKRKKYGSPYYGSDPLLAASELPLKTEAPVQEVKHVVHRPGPDWEERRFELVKTLLGQERRSVVLGKIKASNKQMAATARALADAAIDEMMKHPKDYGYGGNGEETD